MFLYQDRKNGRVLYSNLSKVSQWYKVTNQLITKLCFFALHWIAYCLLEVCVCFSLPFKEVGVCGLLIVVYFANEGFRSIFKLRWVWNLFESRFEEKTDSWNIKSRFQNKTDS